MVAIVTLRADPECFSRSGGGSPLLQALDMDVLGEGKEKMRYEIDGSLRETHAY